MFKLMIALIFILAPLAASQADEIYKTIDENGKVIFSDSPQGNSEKVTISETNRLPPPPHNPVKSSESRQQGKASPTAYTISIGAPLEGTQVTHEQTSIAIQVELSPALNKKHRIQYYVNGAAEGAPRKSRTLTLSNLRRGQKSLSASVIDKDGNVLATSPSVTIFVIRPNPKPK